MDTLDLQGNCPGCDADWKGDPIDTRHPLDPKRTHWSRAIPVTKQNSIGVIAYRCPDCNKETPK